MKKIPANEAIGKTLAYDITEVNREKKIKRRAFKRGHIILESDIEILKSLGKNNIFIEDGELDGVHEDDAAKTVAPLAAGKNIDFDAEPVEGKIGFRAACDGLFKVNKSKIIELNRLQTPSLPTIHNNFPVKKGKSVGGFRIIPLSCSFEVMDKVKEILSEPVMQVIPYKIKTAALLITGTEVFEGRIKDGFEPMIRPKLEAFGVELVEVKIVPDDIETIAAAAWELAEKADFLITTGGTSVDPDDITDDALKKAGVEFVTKGTPLQPGNNFSVGYINGKPACAVPAAAINSQATALDIFLPRILAGDEITADDIAELAYGGLCHLCDECHYPICPFGKS